MWLNWSNCSLDDMYWSPLNIWNVSRSSFVSSLPSGTVLELHWSMGTLKARHFFFFWLFVPQREHLGPRRPSLPTPALWLCVCCVIRCDTKTSLSSSLCQPAALHWKPALTAMTLQPDWTSDPLTPSHRDGAQIHHYYMQTSGLLYESSDMVYLSASVSSLFLFCSLFPGPLWLECVSVIFVFFLCCIIFLCFDLFRV